MQLLAVISLVLAGLLALSAVLKLSHRERVVQSYARLGVPEHKLNALALLLLAGALGLVLGLWWRWLGMAAAAALVCYFSVAIGVHIRAKDRKGLATPLLLALLAAGCLALQLQQ
jgi:hypothetical protein